MQPTASEIWAHQPEQPRPQGRSSNAGRWAGVVLLLVATIGLGTAAFAGVSQIAANAAQSIPPYFGATLQSPHN